MTLEPAARTFVPWEQWRALRDQRSRDTPAAVLLPPDADPAVLREAWPHLEAVALQFAKWTDGRAYSQAWLLRARLGFRGELRAVGDVVLDMLPLLQRTGFDAAELREGQSLEAARRALRAFEGYYQADPFARQA